MAQAKQANQIEGITLLGGEPLAHAAGATLLARAAHDPDLSVMLFPGYTLDDARRLPDSAVPDVLAGGVPGWMAEDGCGYVDDFTQVEERLTFALPQELRRDLRAAGRR